MRLSSSRSSRYLVAALACAGLSLASARAAEPVPMAPADPAPGGAMTAAMDPTTDVQTEVETPEEEATKVYHDRIVTLGLKLGAAINAFNTLGAAFTPELEVGVLLPPLDQSFEIFLAGRFASASDEGDMAPDARLPGGAGDGGIAHWSVTRTDFSLGLGLRYRIPIDGAFTPYLAAGMRAYFLSTEVEGDANDQPFGKNEETGTAFGFMFQLGGEYALGPGALLLELAVNGAALDQTILADTNVSSFDIYLGYRFFF